jgi:hypothetical protein
MVNDVEEGGGLSVLLATERPQKEADGAETAPSPPQSATVFDQPPFLAQADHLHEKPTDSHEYGSNDDGGGGGMEEAEDFGDILAYGQQQDQQVEKKIYLI